MDLASHHFQLDLPLGNLQPAVLLVALDHLINQLVDAGDHIVELARQLADFIRSVDMGDDVQITKRNLIQLAAKAQQAVGRQQ
ncbi:hypothetical protein D3C73_1503690 [compost metagenome]